MDTDLMNQQLEQQVVYVPQVRKKYKKRNMSKAEWVAWVTNFSRVILGEEMTQRELDKDWDMILFERKYKRTRKRDRQRLRSEFCAYLSKQYPPIDAEGLSTTNHQNPKTTK